MARRGIKGITTTMAVVLACVALVVGLFAGVLVYPVIFPQAPAPHVAVFCCASRRRAVAAALDRSAVCETVFLGQATPLYSIIPDGMFGHTEAFKALGDANYELTRSLLADLGHDEDNKLVIDLWYESSGHYPSSEDAALSYKESFEASGVIEVNLHSADWASYKLNRDNEIMQVYIYGWYPDYIDPDNYAFLYFASWLHHNYIETANGALMESLWSQAGATSDEAERLSLYAQIDDMAVQDCPVVPIFQITPYAVSQPNVGGIVMDITQSWRLWLLEDTEGVKDTLIWGTTDSVEHTLDPAQAYDFFGWCIIQQTGLTLVEILPGSEAGAEDIIPALATDWTVSDDLETWTFNLRQGVKFEDGTEVTADDVKYSFDRAKEIACEEGFQVSMGTFEVLIDSVEVTDTYQVVFHLKAPCAYFLQYVACQAFSIVNPNYAAYDSLTEHVEGDARASCPTDCGRYVLTKWERVAGRDVELWLEANPNYWNADEEPKTEKIIIRMYSDETALRLALEAGDIDVAFRHLTSTDIVDLMDNPAVKVWEGKGAAIQYMIFQEHM